MSDIFTETTRRGWFSRIASSVVGVLIGFLLVIGMIVLLFWNEGRAVQTARSLAEGAGAVVSVAADTVDPANEGKLVHVAGQIETDETLTDPDFGISSRGVVLVRRAEMYQWTEDQKSETRKTLGGGEETVTTYSYRKDWLDEPKDSSTFRQPSGHENPDMRWRDKSFALLTARLGARELDVQTLSRVGGNEARPVTAAEAQVVRDTFGWGDASVSQGRIYVGGNPNEPKIGDQRISYELAPLGPISVIARQQGNGFSHYQTSAGDALFMVERGTVPAAQMFADAVSANTAVTWILRAVGILLLAIGFALTMGPVGVIADVIPFLGTLVRMGTGLVAVVLAVLVGSVVIAFAWVWYRPLLALAILGGGVLVAWLAGRYAKRTAPAATPAAA